MPVVRTSSLIDGMVVADDIIVNGKKAVPAGTVIVQELAKKLALAGIKQVIVTEESYGLAVMFTEPELARGESTTVRRAKARNTIAREKQKKAAASSSTAMDIALRRVAHMFEQHRDDPVMRELCRLAIKVAQERLIRV